MFTDAARVNQKRWSPSSSWCRENFCPVASNIIASDIHRTKKTSSPSRGIRPSGAFRFLRIQQGVTPVYTARPRIWGWCIARCACLRRSFCRYSLRLRPTHGRMARLSAISCTANYEIFCSVSYVVLHSVIITIILKITCG